MKPNWASLEATRTDVLTQNALQLQLHHLEKSRQSPSSQGGMSVEKNLMGSPASGARYVELRRALEVKARLQCDRAFEAFSSVLTDGWENFLTTCRALFPRSELDADAENHLIMAAWKSRAATVIAAPGEAAGFDRELERDAQRSWAYEGLPVDFTDALTASSCPPCSLLPRSHLQAAGQTLATVTPPRSPVTQAAFSAQLQKFLATREGR